MTELLMELLEAGLIEKVDGDDARMAKIEKAAGVVAQELQKHPPGLIRAVLAGLDPDVPADDPAIVQAKQALVAEWRSMASVYTDTPIGLLRAILLEACSQVGEAGDKAAVLWFTVADTLPLRRLGREGRPVQKMIEEFASRTEEVSIVLPKLPDASGKVTPSGQAESAVPETIGVRKVDRDSLLLRVASAVAPNFRGQALISPNPHWPNQFQHWSGEFTDRMSVLLADELDELAQSVQQQQAQVGQQLKGAMSVLTKQVESELRSQERLLRDKMRIGEQRIEAEKLRLDTLWWSEALYSSTFRRSYRDMDSLLAAAVMPLDLLAYVSRPCPASVGYLLAEAVNRLSGAGFEQKRGMRDLLLELRKLRGDIPKGQKLFEAPPAEGRLSLRDIVAQSLQGGEWDIEVSMRRAGLTSDVALSLPAVAHAIFRQEHAVRLAGSGK